MSSEEFVASIDKLVADDLSSRVVSRIQVLAARMGTSESPDDPFYWKVRAR